jgi:hypothetical protein
MEALRRIGLAATNLPNATCGSIRLKLLKIGAIKKASPSDLRPSTRNTPYQRRHTDTRREKTGLDWRVELFRHRDLESMINGRP